ncbi:MAG TPA: MFS transporter [Verrucomicrobiae bacterium]|jgi:predicted MFS family arabinose efflux permease|nr:MFS transporter [Verrucomicrobiae bacterium]
MMPTVSHPCIRSRPLKLCVFGITALTSGSTTFFFYYLYFLTKDKFGFSQTQNLMLAAALGYVYCAASYVAGRFAHRFGYFFSIRFGLTILILTLGAASQMKQAWPMLGLVVIGNFGMCFCWPALEALMSEGEPPARLQSLVGLYCISWSAAGALTYFAGGAVLQHFGQQSLFFAPVGVFVGVMLFLSWFEKQVENQPPARADLAQTALHVVAEGYRSPIPAKIFLQMGWLTNPMAYLVVNTVVSTIPSLAEHFQFRPMMAGFVCSTWLFARAATFMLLRLWPRWHYRFRFLGFGFVAMIVSFILMLSVRNLWVLILSQLVLGGCLGLIYYSSLFYSMDVGEAKSEHGGIHEAAIGLGSGSGPAMAAGSVALFPASRASGPVGVSVLLVMGFGMLLWMRFKNYGPRK